MANKRTFLTGALWGAAVACIADQLLRRRGAGRRRFGLIGGGRVLQLPPKETSQQDAAGPAEAAPYRNSSRPVFERRSAGAGSTRAPEAAIANAAASAADGQDQNDAAQPPRSAKRAPGLPAQDR